MSYTVELTLVEVGAPVHRSDSRYVVKDGNRVVASGEYEDDKNGHYAEDVARNCAIDDAASRGQYLSAEDIDVKRLMERVR